MVLLALATACGGDDGETAKAKGAGVLQELAAGEGPAGS